MVELCILLAVFALKVLLDKGLFLGVFLLAFFLKGKRMGFRSEAWDNYFLTLSFRKAQSIGIVIYGIAAVLSSAVSCLILSLAGFRHSLLIAAALLLAAFLVTAIRYHKKGKAYLVKRLSEIPQTIMERQKGEQTEEKI